MFILLKAHLTFKAFPGKNTLIATEFDHQNESFWAVLSWVLFCFLCFFFRVLFLYFFVMVKGVLAFLACSWFCRGKPKVCLFKGKLLSSGFLLYSCTFSLYGDWRILPLGAGGGAWQHLQKEVGQQDSRHHAMSFIQIFIFLTTTRLARISESINRNVFHHLSISEASFYVTDVHIVF